MWNPPWSVQVHWLDFWIELDLVFSFQFSQACEELREFFLEISRLSNHLSKKSNQIQVNTSVLNVEGVQLTLENIKTGLVLL